MTRYVLAYALVILAVCALLTKLEERKANGATTTPAAARSVEVGVNG
jgi:hypothetical protein